MVAWVVGYSFCVLAPKTNGAKGLAITLVSLGGVNTLLRLTDAPCDRWLNLLFQLAFCAELIILPLFLAACAKAKKSRKNADDCMVACYIGIGYTVLVLILAILSETRGISFSSIGGLGWIFKILRWGRNIGLLVYLGFLIKAAFGVRRRVE